MSIPEPDKLSLLQSADYIADKTGKSEKKAKTALYAALQQGALCVHATTKSIRHLDSHEKVNTEEAGRNSGEEYTILGIALIPEEYWRHVSFEKVFKESETGILNATNDGMIAHVGWQFASYDGVLLAGHYLNPTIQKKKIDEWLLTLKITLNTAKDPSSGKTKSNKPRYQANRVKDWALKQNDIPHSASKIILGEIEDALGGSISAKTARAGFKMAKQERDAGT